MYRPDHAFARTTLLRALRPIEIFMFHQLLRCLARSESSLNVNPGLLRAKNTLFLSLLQTAARSMWLPPPPGPIATSGGAMHAYDDNIPAEFLVPRLW